MPNIVSKFNHASHTYDKATPIQSDVALFLAKHIHHICQKDAYQKDNFPKTANQLWLDVGCGTGKLSQAVLNQNQTYLISRLIGIDNSQAMLNLWQKNCQNGYKEVKNINFQPILANMTKLPFADNSVDVVMSSFAVHWVAPAVISEFGRVLKKNGHLFLAIPVKGSLSEVSERFSKLSIYPFLPSDDWKQVIKQLISERNGELCFFDERQFSYSYPNLKTLLAELRNMGGAVSGRTPIDTATLRQYLNDANPLNLDYQILTVGVQLN